MGGSKPQQGPGQGSGWGWGHVGQTGLQSPPRWNGLSVRTLFCKHKKQSSEFKLESPAKGFAGENETFL